MRQLLSHQAGLVAIKPPLTLADIADPEKMSAKIAGQAPAWAPGTRYGYHAVTLGWYQSELIRRVDPQGRTLGRFFAEEIAAPLDLDFYIGLPASVDRSRVAHLVPVTRRRCCCISTRCHRYSCGTFQPVQSDRASFRHRHGYQGGRRLQP